MIARLTDEQLDERVRAYLNYRAEAVASRAATAEATATVVARHLGIGAMRPSANFRMVRLAFALLLLILALAAAVYVGSLFREHYAPDRPLLRVPLDGEVTAVTGAYGSIWAAVYLDAGASAALPAPALTHIDELDPRDGTLRTRIEVEDFICGNIESGYGALWYTHCRNHTLVRLDARSHKEDRLVGYGNDRVGIGADSIWASDGMHVVRLDPTTLDTEAEIDVGGEALITYGEDSVWAMVHDSGYVTRIDPATNHVIATIPLSEDPNQPARPVHGVVGGGALWAVDETAFKIYRVDTDTNEVTQLRFEFDHELAEGMEFGDWYITYGRGLLWVRYADDTVVAIDPVSYQIVDTRTTSHQGGPGAFFVSDDSLWVGNGWGRDLTGIRLP